MANKNTQAYQEEVFILILHQILVTNSQGAARGENWQSDLGSLRVKQYFPGLLSDQYLTTHSHIFYILHLVNSYNLGIAGSLHWDGILSFNFPIGLRWFWCGLRMHSAILLTVFLELSWSELRSAVWLGSYRKTMAAEDLF